MTPTQSIHTPNIEAFNYFALTPDVAVCTDRTSKNYRQMYALTLQHAEFKDGAQSYHIMVAMNEQMPEDEIVNLHNYMAENKVGYSGLCDCRDCHEAREVAAQ